MHLMELSERPSAILMVHKARNNGLPFWNKLGQGTDSNQVVVAFEAFQQLNQVSIRPTTAMPSMHEDICTGAEAKRAAMIILPFHKHQRVDGHMETTRAEMRHVNRRVLEQAPCSVSIFIDRGLGGPAHVPASDVDYVVTAFFFGGPDDREALSYGAIMAEHPGIRFNAVLFVVDAEVVGKSVKVDVVEDHWVLEGRSSDEEFLSEFRGKVSNHGSIKLVESVVSNAAEAVGVIRSYKGCNLFLVGRIPEGEMVAALNKESECPELGPVGNLLISGEMSTRASILVVQQYRNRLTGDALESLKGGDLTNEPDYDSQ